MLNNRNLLAIDLHLTTRLVLLFSIHCCRYGVTRMVSLVEQERLVIPDLTSSLHIVCGIASKTCLQGKSEDTKRVIRSCKSKKDILCNGQKKKRITMINNDLQNTTQKTVDWATRGPNCACDKWNISVVISDTDIP